MSGSRYLVNLEPKRVRSIARLLRRLADRLDQAWPPVHMQSALCRAVKESENLMACAKAAEDLLKADVLQTLPASSWARLKRAENRLAALKAPRRKKS